jgi:hypothetical protein
LLAAAESIADNEQSLLVAAGDTIGDGLSLLVVSDNIVDSEKKMPVGPGVWALLLTLTCAITIIIIITITHKKSNHNNSMISSS